MPSYRNTIYNFQLHTRNLSSQTPHPQNFPISFGLKQICLNKRIGKPHVPPRWYSLLPIRLPYSFKLSPHNFDVCNNYTQHADCGYSRQRSVAKLYVIQQSYQNKRKVRSAISATSWPLVLLMSPPFVSMMMVMLTVALLRLVQ